MLREAHVVDYDAPEPGGEGVPLPLRVWAFIAANRRTIVRTALALFVVAVVATVLSPRRYEATMAFTPSSDSRSNLGAVAGLASQLGLQIDLGTKGENLAFYAALIESRELLQRAVLSTYKVRRDDGSVRTGNLMELLDVKAPSPAMRINRAVKKLDGLLTVRSNPQANIIEVKVATKWPDLSEQIADRVLVLVNEFNLERRQSQSRQEARFTGDRLAAARRELRQAEEAQLSFLRANRSYQESPTLAYEAVRLQRDVQLKQEVFITLNKGYEQARIAEVRDTPVLTVIDSAIAPVRRSSPRRTLGTLIAFAISGLIGVAAAYVAESRTWRQAVAPRNDSALRDILEDVPGAR
jgi:uncharacterized protein involved in exopolysaccharide biosynthesis